MSVQVICKQLSGYDFAPILALLLLLLRWIPSLGVNPATGVRPGAGSWEISNTGDPNAT